jgi:hypothetical protein
MGNEPAVGGSVGSRKKKDHEGTKGRKHENRNPESSFVFSLFRVFGAPGEVWPF